MNRVLLKRNIAIFGWCLGGLLFLFMLASKTYQAEFLAMSESQPVYGLLPLFAFAVPFQLLNWYLVGRHRLNVGLSTIEYKNALIRQPGPWVGLALSAWVWV